MIHIGTKSQLELLHRYTLGHIQTADLILEVSVVNEKVFVLKDRFDLTKKFREANESVAVKDIPDLMKGYFLTLAGVAV